MRSVRRIRSIAPEQAWKQVARGEAQLLDLRTELERRRYGWRLAYSVSAGRARWLDELVREADEAP